MFNRSERKLLDIDDTDQNEEWRGRGRREEQVSQLEELRRQPPASFPADGSILHAFEQLRGTVDLRDESPDRASWRRLESLRRHAHRVFHRALRASERTRLGAWCARHRLNRLEVDILLVLVQEALGLSSDGTHLGALAKALAFGGHDRLAVYRACAEGSRLRLTESICPADDDEDQDPSCRDMAASREIYEPLLRRQTTDPGPIATWEAWLQGTYRLANRFRSQSESVRSGVGHRVQLPWQRREGSGSGISRMVQDTQRHLSVARSRRDWPIAGFPLLRAEEWLLLMVMIGKELGYFDADDDLFTGEGLAAGLARDITEVRGKLDLLMPAKRLGHHRLIRVCGGGEAGDPLQASPAAIAAAEFELSDSCLKRLNMERRRRTGQQTRDPRLKMDQLVLAPPVHAALELALAQCRHQRTLVERWGLGRLLPYGRGVTLLFAGPPGVGKTAAAEALAAALGRRILVVDYSQIQNCWVGMTEKNIVAAFQAAAAEDAVLFWDEADAMFFDRGQADRNWEVREVNVLLQQIERFHGVCVLATNRRDCLDEALERRLGLRIEFQRPGPVERRQLWELFLGHGLPLARGVNPATLAEHDLSGGQIKNVILNAARAALRRGPHARINTVDLGAAVEREISVKDGTTVGFELPTWRQRS